MYGSWGPSTHVVDFLCEHNGRANELSISQICPRLGSSLQLGSGNRTMLAEWVGACGMLITNSPFAFLTEYTD